MEEIDEFNRRKKPDDYFDLDDLFPNPLRPFLGKTEKRSLSEKFGISEN